jgi:hypothetical protein
MPRSFFLVLLLMLTLAGFAARARAQEPAAPAPPAAPVPQLVVAGTVFDTLSNRPLRLAVVRIVENGASTLTDDAGHYRLFAAPGPIHLEVHRIGYEPVTLVFEVKGRYVSQNAYLRPLPIGLAPVEITGADQFARSLIMRAIARKHEIFTKSHDFSYETYVKNVVRDLERHPDSASSVLLITEVRTLAYWEEPDHFQERILARRQTNNLPAQMNIFSASDLVRLDRDRIDFFHKYSLVSPIADDALSYYDYRVLDTLHLDGRRVYRLAIEPRTQATPLLVGMIDIADSTFDVEQMDVGGNDVVRINGLRNLRYRQRYRNVGDGRWMPYDIRFTGEALFAVPLPGFPTHMAFEQRALLDSFRFDQRDRPAGLNEFRIVVDDRADRADSASWAGPGAIPLSHAERAAWARIDSLESLPLDLPDRVVRSLMLGYKLSRNPDFYHFSRVEGSYVGAGGTWWQIPGASLRAKLGYGTGNDEWQYRFGAGVRLSEAQRLWLDASYFDETTNRPTLISRDYNPTYRALFFRLDPLDYYREHGWTVTLNSKLLNFTEFDLRYKDVSQSSLDVVTDYALFSTDRLQRLNPAILGGHLRSIRGSLVYDSRPLLRAKGQDYYLESIGQNRTRISFVTEVSAPGVIPSDFNFQRYSIQLDRRQRTFNLGVTTIVAAAGVALGDVPPQRYFTVDFGMKALTFQGNGFNTLSETNYSGTRAAMFTIRHNFDRLLFAKTHIPGVRKLPFTLSVQGGAFWTDFATGHVANPGDNLLVSAHRPYTELGFGIGNLTPFLAPFNLAAHFTWQLSSYPTNRVVFGLGLTPP